MKSTSPKEEHCKNKYGNKIVSRGQRNRLHQKKSTAKNKYAKIVSRSQRNRLHQKKNTAKNKYASKSPSTTSFKERHPPERDANRNQKGKLEN